MTVATAIQNRVKEREVQARAKMAAFIDHVVDVIETTPKRKKRPTPRATRTSKARRSA
jgi:hypothetical protein